MAIKNKSGLRARGLHAGALDWHAPPRAYASTRRRRRRIE